MTTTAERSNAHLQEGEDGPYYPIRLVWLPRIGDHVRFYSAKDAMDGHAPGPRPYTVTAVIHEMADVTEKTPDGQHFVTVRVRPAQPEGR